MRVWLRCLQECVLTLYMSGAKGGSPLDRFLHFAKGSGEEGLGKDSGVTIQFFPTSPQPSFFLPGAVVPGPGLQLLVPEAGKITKQKTVTLPLSLYVRIPKGLMGLIAPSLHGARLRLTVSTAVPEQPAGSVPVQTSMNGSGLRGKHLLG